MRAGALALATLAALLAASGPARAKEQLPPFPQGLYGNVRFSEGSGDFGGFEVRFYRDPAGGTPMDEFTLCEGWCNEAYTATVTREGEGFTFSHIEVLESSDGTREEHKVRYRVVPRGRRLEVFYAYDGEDFTKDAPWRIRPLKRPFGLEVAQAATRERSGRGER